MNLYMSDVYDAELSGSKGPTSFSGCSSKYDGTFYFNT